jgi:hypothetical protein
MERRQLHNGLTMITFHSRRSDCGRRVQKITNASTFNFTPRIETSICIVAFTKCEKSGAIIFKSRCRRLSLICHFIHGQALPLSFVRFFRLAKISPKIARSPARRSRDGRETSGKKSGKMSRVIFAQRPGNGRVVAAAMPLNVRQDDSQDNWPCAGIRRAMSAPETCEITRNTIAQQPCRSLHNGQCNISRAAYRILVIGF